MHCQRDPGAITSASLATIPAVHTTLTTLCTTIHTAIVAALPTSSTTLVSAFPTAHTTRRAALTTTRSAVVAISATSSTATLVAIPTRLRATAIAGVAIPGRDDRSCCAGTDRPSHKRPGGCSLARIVYVSARAARHACLLASPQAPGLGQHARSAGSRHAQLCCTHFRSRQQQTCGGEDRSDNRPACRPLPRICVRASSSFIFPGLFRRRRKRKEYAVAGTQAPSNADGTFCRHGATSVSRSTINSGSNTGMRPCADGCSSKCE
mmetsp:Transcript_65866/g.196785  ORF Transcript_65866/g.196785 Transcript_65866/m.196785 type:complete len:265 (+) Transcript_65866:1057-1851(+)